MDRIKKISDSLWEKIDDLSLWQFLLGVFLGAALIVMSVFFLLANPFSWVPIVLVIVGAAVGVVVGIPTLLLVGRRIFNLSESSKYNGFMDPGSEEENAGVDFEEKQEVLEEVLLKDEKTRGLFFKFLKRKIFDELVYDSIITDKKFILNGVKRSAQGYFVDIDENGLNDILVLNDSKYFDNIELAQQGDNLIIRCCEDKQTEDFELISLLKRKLSSLLARYGIEVNKGDLEFAYYEQEDENDIESEDDEEYDSIMAEYRNQEKEEGGHFNCLTMPYRLFNSLLTKFREEEKPSDAVHSGQLGATGGKPLSAKINNIEDILTPLEGYVAFKIEIKQKSNSSVGFLENQQKILGAIRNNNGLILTSQVIIIKASEAEVECLDKIFKSMSVKFPKKSFYCSPKEANGEHYFVIDRAFFEKLPGKLDEYYAKKLENKQAKQEREKGHKKLSVEDNNNNNNDKQSASGTSLTSE